MADWNDDEVDLTLLFPIESFTPNSKCTRHRLITKGSNLCCAICHKSGRDHKKLPGLPPDSKPKTDYIPDPVVTIYVAPETKQAAPGKRRPVVKQFQRKPPPSHSAS